MMILFAEDWKRHPTAIVHYSTTNTTWVRLAGVYNAMRVKNCLFHLALHNPALANIDPHDPNITKEQIAMIIEECAENPWYVFREIMRVPPIAGPTSLPLRANRGNIALYWLYFNHITTMLIQPRQTGKSISLDSLSAGLLNIFSINTDMGLLTKDDALRSKNIKRIKDIISYLPYYLQLKTKKDSNNSETITVELLKNTLYTAVPQSSKKAALKVFRGMSIPTNFIDEIAFIVNNDITVPAALASAGAARDCAAAVGAPYGNLFTTTPGYLATDSGKYAYSIYNESCMWSDQLMDSKDLDELRDRLVKNSSGGVEQVTIDLNHRQLGYTDDWLRRKIAEAKAKGKAIEADFLGRWPGGNESGLVSEDKLKLINKHKINSPNVIISSHGYIVKRYCDLATLKNSVTVAGLDTSDAIGKDGIGFVIRCIRTGAVLATGDFNETNTIVFANWLAEFLIDFPNMLLVPERKSTGVSIIDALIEIMVSKSVDPFKRIFNWVVNDYNVKEVYRDEVINVNLRDRDPSVYVRYRKYFGYVTTGSGRSSRSMLYGEVFNSSVTYTADTIRDPRLINQLSGLVVKNNRIDHATGNNDDLVIAWLLAYWTLTKAENIDYYNIPKHKVLTNVAEAVVEEQGGTEAIEKREYQLELKASIDELVDEIHNTTSVIKAKMLTRRVMYLYRDLDTSVIQSFNIDTLIENLAIEKKRDQYVRRF